MEKVSCENLAMPENYSKGHLLIAKVLKSARQKLTSIVFAIYMFKRLKFMENITIKRSEKRE